MPGHNHFSWCLCGWCYKSGRNGYSPSALVRNLDAFDADRRLEREGVKRSWTACFVVPNARCPVCSAQVYYYENANGSRVFFDDLGWPWPKHPCTDNRLYAGHVTGLKASPLATRKLGEVKEIMESANRAGFDPNARFRSAVGEPPWDLLLVVSVTRTVLETFIEARFVSPPMQERTYFRLFSAPDAPAVDAFVSSDGAQLSFINLDTLRSNALKATILSREAFMSAVRDAKKGTSDLLSAQLPRIKAAAEILDPEFVRRYSRLRQLLVNDGPLARKAFENEFTSYYGLNAGGVTQRFRDVYFDRLYALRGRAVDVSYGPILRELYEIPRHKGDKALPCSFVSKLVAIHDESRPLFDKYVGRFFGLAAPKSVSLELRIAGFVSNLGIIRANYQAWIEDERYQAVFEQLRNRIPELQECHLVRICDFLVWQAGKMEGKLEPDEFEEI